MHNKVALCSLAIVQRRFLTGRRRLRCNAWFKPTTLRLYKTLACTAWQRWLHVPGSLCLWHEDDGHSLSVRTACSPLFETTYRWVQHELLKCNNTTDIQLKFTNRCNWKTWKHHCDMLTEHGIQNTTWLTCRSMDIPLYCKGKLKYTL